MSEVTYLEPAPSTETLDVIDTDLSIIEVPMRFAPPGLRRAKPPEPMSASRHVAFGDSGVPLLSYTRWERVVIPLGISMAIACLTLLVVEWIIS